MPRVLVVSRDLGVGAPIVDELERRGFDLTWCPGAGEPTYICLGGQGKACPLAHGADVVVLDGWLAADEARKGVPAWHLLLYYRSLGAPAIFLVGPDAPPGRAPDASVVLLPRRSPAAEVVDAVESLLQPAAVGSAD